MIGSLFWDGLYLDSSNFQITTVNLIMTKVERAMLALKSTNLWLYEWTLSIVLWGSAKIPSQATKDPFENPRRRRCMATVCTTNRSWTFIYKAFSQRETVQGSHDGACSSNGVHGDHRPTIPFWQSKEEPRTDLCGRRTRFVCVKIGTGPLAVWMGESPC